MKPKSLFSHKALRCVVACLAAFALTGQIASAVPYATGLTNTGSSISFRLNESADVVKIIYNAGAVTNNLGAQPAGLVTVNIAIIGAFRVEVTKTAGAGYLQGSVLQISSDNNPLLAFEQPVGVAVNRNSASPYFGRIYVSNSRPLAAATGRLLQEGIYVLNPDFSDALGQGDNALTGGIDFTDKSGDNQNTTLPWRVEVGQDDNLYITDFTTNSGTVYVTDPNLSAGSGTNVLDGLGTPGISSTAGLFHGQIASSVIVTGALASANLTLFALDADTAPINGIKRWDVAGGPLPSMAVYSDLTGFGSPLLQISRVIVDMDMAPSGKFYLSQYRSAGNEGGLFVVDNQDQDMDGALDLLYSSLGDWRVITGDPTTNDILRNSYAVKVSPNGSVIAVGRNDGPTWIIPLDPTTGLPQLLNRVQLATASAGPTRDVCFDAAGNLYVVNNNIERLRVFSPGGRWVATTGSDGTFSVTNPPVTIPELSITALTTNMYERVSANKTTVNVTRVGTTDTDLTVKLGFTGAAANGVDYQTVPATVVIPSGSASAFFAVTPIDNSELTGNKAAIISLVADSAYNIVASGAAVALQVTDDEAPLGQVLFSDDFETDTSANYGVKFTAGSGGNDYRVEFAYDYSAEGIPAAPHSAAGTKGVKVRVNKNFDDASVAALAAVNLYPLGKNFSGDFAFRADVLMSIGTDLGGTTEHTIFGINHSGNKALRHAITDSDGLWFAVDTDGSNNRGYGFYGTASAAATTLLKTSGEFNWAFPSPPYGFAGAPSVVTNTVALTGGEKIWADLEVRQVGGVVTMKLNNIPVFVFTNSYAFTSGTVMIGHNDQFNSVGSTNTYSLYDNVRVIDLSTRITDIAVTGGNVVIDFVTPTGGAFTNYSAAAVEGPYTPDTGTTLITNRPGVYRATTPVNGASRFYRIGRSALQP